MQWIANNRTTRNIKMVLGVGDMVNTAIQWQNADASVDTQSVVRLLPLRGFTGLIATETIRECSGETDNGCLGLCVAGRIWKIPSENRAFVSLSRKGIALRHGWLYPAGMGGFKPP
jgi:hypothetical protein